MSLTRSSTPSARRGNDGEVRDEEASSKKARKSYSPVPTRRPVLNLGNIPVLARPDAVPSPVPATTGPQADGSSAGPISTVAQPASPVRRSGRNVAKPETYNVRRLAEQASASPVGVNMPSARKSTVRRSWSPTKRTGSPKKR
ncbi:hypothetical protein GQ44DRAFT_713139 [Phaeosphaeriaceae sp. PMI808]|nr:hypothetical protein GQ44DRAFT_713139 [Phaeosphaeriaceae sp. PMI808]